jgi:F0F1-type ATP synthase assembly protein I
METNPQSNFSDSDKVALEKELATIKSELQRYQDKAFIMLIELIGIIGIPALIAVLVKEYVFAEAGSGITVLLIGIAIAVSWSIIIYRGIKLSKAMSALTSRRREIQDLLGIERPKRHYYPDESKED